MASVTLAAACCILTGAAHAEIETSVSTAMDVTTLSTQSHPKRIELAYLATNRRRIEGVGLEYVLDRWNWNDCCDIDLVPGGRMIATVKLIRESGSEIVGRKKRSRCEASIFSDDLGTYNQRYCFLDWEEIELDLEPGDVLLWTVKFKGVPNLEVEPYYGSLYRDRFTLTGSLLPPPH